MRERPRTPNRDRKGAALYSHRDCKGAAASQNRAREEAAASQNHTRQEAPITSANDRCTGSAVPMKNRVGGSPILTILCRMAETVRPDRRSDALQNDSSTGCAAW